MYTLLIKQFFRSKTVWLAFGILMFLGALSINTGKQFLTYQTEAVQKTIAHQQKHLETQKKYYKDDIAYLTYYLKFAFINPVDALSGISIGQSDLNSHIQSVGIVALEGQKHNTDLINPMRQQVGNLDMSFLIIFLFPLIIIALNFNILSQEEESGTWKMITIQAKSAFNFLIAKLFIRLIFIVFALTILFLVAKIVMHIPWSTNFFTLIAMSYLYILFWFALCLFVILLRKSSSTNAIVLLASWLLLVVFIPALVSNYISSKYPVNEAFSMVIKQRDAYHQKWDTDKEETLKRFYKRYPHLEKYGYPTEGFTWLWYYAMQQLGDDDSQTERNAMYAKIKQREAVSKNIARFFPPLQLQLSMNELAKTSLTNHIDFLDATTKFHENIRLDIYPSIFENRHPSTVDLNKYKPEFFKPKTHFTVFKNILPLVLITCLLIGFAIFKNLKTFK